MVRIMLIDFSLLAPIAILLLIVSLIIFKKKYKKDNIYLFFYSIFFIYICYVISYTQFPIILNDEMRSAIGQNVFRDSNFIPIINHLTVPDLKFAILNIIMTIPFGFGLPFLTKASFKKILLLGFLLGCAIEIMQLFVALIVGFTLRYVDINDVIYNTLGAIIGYGFFKLFSIFFRYLIKKHNLKLNSFLKSIFYA